MAGILVRFRDWDDATVDAVAAEHGLTVAGLLPFIRTALLAGASDEAATIAALTSDPRVSYAGPNRKFSTTGYFAPANDAKANDSWGWKRTGLWRAHALLQADTLRRLGAARIGDPALKVAVLDSGYRVHEDVPNPVAGASFALPYGIDDTHLTTPPLSDGRDPDPVNDPGYFIPDDWDHGEGWPVVNSHGSACASIILGRANNALGMTGAAPGASYLAARWNAGFLNSGQEYEVLAGLNWCLGQAARVVSMSLAGTFDGGEPTNYPAGITAAWVAGGIPVVAAGNDDWSLDVHTTYPAEAPPAVTVGAIAKDNRRCSYNQRPLPDWGPGRGSNYGTPVEIVAPGTQVPVASYDSGADYFPGGIGPSNFYGWFSGTSAATPIVAGALALILSANPNLTNAQAIAILYATADPTDLDADFPNAAGCVRHDAATAKALSTVPANAGRVYTALHFYGAGENGTWDRYNVVAGTLKVALDGAIRIRPWAFCSEEIAALEVWAGAKCVYAGPVPSGLLTGTAVNTGTKQAMRIVTYTSAGVRWPEPVDEADLASLVVDGFTPRGFTAYVKGSQVYGSCAAGASITVDGQPATVVGTTWNYGVTTPGEHGASISDGVDSLTVTVEYHAPITATCLTGAAAIGATTYDPADPRLWEIIVTPHSGLNTFAISDGVETVNVEVEGTLAGETTFGATIGFAASGLAQPPGIADPFPAQVAFATNASAGHLGATGIGAASFGSSADADARPGYFLARNASLGRSWVAGPYAAIPVYGGDVALGVSQGYSADAVSAQVGAAILAASLGHSSDAFSAQVAAAQFNAAQGFTADAVALAALLGDAAFAAGAGFVTDAVTGHVVDLGLAHALGLISDAGYQAALSAAGAADLAALHGQEQEAVYRGPDLVADQTIATLLGLDCDAAFGPRYDTEQEIAALFGLDADARFSGTPAVVYPPIVCSLPDLTVIGLKPDLTIVRELPDLTFTCDSAEVSDD